MTTFIAHIGIGANLGDAQATVRTALLALAGLPGCQLQRASSVYRSAPVEAGGPDFYNAVAVLETTLPPVSLLAQLQAVELAFGRERPFPNAPRTLDLDLLLVGDQVLNTPALTLPHPRIQQRAFVLQPLLELDPSQAAPGLGQLARYLPATAAQRIDKLGALSVGGVAT